MTMITYASEMGHCKIMLSETKHSLAKAAVERLIEVSCSSLRL